MARNRCIERRAAHGLPSLSASAQKVSSMSLCRMLRYACWRDAGPLGLQISHPISTPPFAGASACHLRGLVVHDAIFVTVAEAVAVSETVAQVAGLTMPAAHRSTCPISFIALCQYRAAAMFASPVAGAESIIWNDPTSSFGSAVRMPPHACPQPVNSQPFCRPDAFAVQSRGGR